MVGPATRVDTEYVYRGKHNHAYFREPDGAWHVLPRVRPISWGQEDFDHGGITPGARLLAFSLLAHAVGGDEAREFHLRFVGDVISGWKRDRMWSIRQGTIRAWVEAARMAQVLRKG